MCLFEIKYKVRLQTNYRGGGRRRKIIGSHNGDYRRRKLRNNDEQGHMQL